MKKMNKKGFTLVELLAVIVILALIMAIAVISMSGIMSGARKSAMKETAVQIINGVRQQLTLNNKLIASQDRFTRAEGEVYYVSKNMLEKGGDSAPLGGTYRFQPVPSTPPNELSRLGIQEQDPATAVPNSTCNGNVDSYVRVRYVNGNWEWSICLVAQPLQSGNKPYPYITDYINGSYKTETDLLKSDDTSMIVEDPAVISG